MSSIPVNTNDVEPESADKPSSDITSTSADADLGKLDGKRKTSAENALLFVSDEGPSKDFPHIVESLDAFSAAFENTAINLSKGVESVKMGQNFLERWTKIELTYAKSMEELLESKQARLYTTHKNVDSDSDGSPTDPSYRPYAEPVPEVYDAWKDFTTELAHVVEDRKNIAIAVRDTVCKKLALFNSKLGQRIDNLLAEARRLLSDSRAVTSSLTSKQKKYIELCKTAAEDVTLVAPAYEPESKESLMEVLKTYAKSTLESTGIISGSTELDPARMTPPQKRRMATRVAQLESPSVRKILDEVKKETQAIKRETSVASARSHVAFEEMLPTILNALHDIETDRVSYFKHAIGHVATGMVSQARRTQFVDTRAKIDHIRPELIRTCVVRAVVPPPPDFSHVNWDELLDADVQAVAEIGDGEHGGAVLGDKGWVHKDGTSADAALSMSDMDITDAATGKLPASAATETSHNTVDDTTGNAADNGVIPPVIDIANAVVPVTSTNDDAKLSSRTSSVDSAQSTGSKGGSGKPTGLRMWWTSVKNRSRSTPKKAPATTVSKAVTPPLPPRGTDAEESLIREQDHFDSTTAESGKHDAARESPRYVTPPIFKSGRQLSSPYFDPLLTPSRQGQLPVGAEGRRSRSSRTGSPTVTSPTTPTLARRGTSRLSLSSTPTGARSAPLQRKKLATPTTAM
eukprot:m.696696 g.696696  ORF g.696696 m.696696 type:complete len:690 (+) comp22895_c0_seq5:314-2383(+)